MLLVGRERFTTSQIVGSKNFRFRDIASFGNGSMEEVVMGASLRMSCNSMTEVGLNFVNANPVNCSELVCVWLRWVNDDLIFLTFSVKK
jgi:hypothetical protein